MVKVISLSNSAYEKLKALKGEKSFSETVVELVDNKKFQKRSIMKFCGICKDDDYWENFKKEIRKSRKNVKLREVKF